MTTTETPRVAYVMKRYPRLTETFILNEIAVMERLGVELALFSLLQPEPPPHHPMVKDIQSPLFHLSPDRWEKIKAVTGAHVACCLRAPLRYGRALFRAVYASLQSRRRLGVWKQFARAGFVADRCSREKVTLIHAHFANTPAAVAWFASAMTGIPYSFTTHAKDLYLTSARAMRRRVRGAAFVATCTRYNVDYLRSILPNVDRDKVHLVYHGIDIGRFVVRAARWSDRDSRVPLILSVGRLVPKKGLGDLIAACQMLHETGIRFRSIIVGNGPLRDELSEDISRRGLNGIVSLNGAMTHADLIELYQKADVFALPPRVVADGDRDGIPNVIAEAMATGVPVVTTSVSGIPELVENGITGLLVPSESPAAFAAALRQILGNPQSGAELARNARARIEANFDCRETTKALRDLMQVCSCGGRHDMKAARRKPLSTPIAEAAE